MSSYYRYEDVQYAAALDEWDNPQGSGRLAIELRTYPLIRSTFRGVWIDVHGTPKFVLDSATKRFALPTKEEALTSFIARKKRQMTILEAQLNRATRAYQQAILSTR